MTKRYLLSLASIFVLLAIMAQKPTTDPSPQGTCPIVKIDAERLPDLNIPRSGHSAFVANGDPTVVGGHISGFVLSPTAEYYKDGEWHLLQTVYPHDGGFYVPLQSGKVMLAGGFKENLGIGQSFEVEMYDPVAHHFDGFGCLDQKRASAAGLELDSGRVFITGNWYADDCMELFDGHNRFNYLKPTRQTRYLPYLLRSSDGDVMIVGYQDNRGQQLDSIIIERMKGEPFKAPLFDTWHLLHLDMPINSENFFIGDKEKGDYAYLLPVRNKEGQVAIAEVRDTVFSLLPTDSPVPTVNQWGGIYYYSPFYADRPHQRGYVMGCDSTGRQYALCVDYAKKPAHLTLYHTDPLTETIAFTIPVMLDDGNLMLTGIKPSIEYNFNFKPTAQIWLLRFNDSTSATVTVSISSWQWIVLGILLFDAILAAIYFHRRRKHRQAKGAEEEPAKPQSASASSNKKEEFKQRISKMIIEEKLYLDSNLTTSFIAEKLGIHRNYISEYFPPQEGSLMQLVNSLRVEHAKKLMQQHPDMKLNTIGNDSGFANETSFYRTFKAFTGMTPTEWKSTIV